MTGVQTCALPIYKVVLDGNHPLAGIALRFWLQVFDVREATDEEIEEGHPQGEYGLSIDQEDAEDDDDTDFYPETPPQRPTIH